MKITNHHLEGAMQAPSPNTSGSLFPVGIMQHYTAGASGDVAVSWLRNSAAGASAHVVIYPDGRIAQLVPFNTIAWHAGTANIGTNPWPNRTHIGIEMVNPGFFLKDPNSPTGYLYPDPFWRGERAPVSPEVLADWPVTDAYSNAVGRQVGWCAYTKAQLDADEALCDALIETYPAIADMTGHENVRSDKSDPGPLFPMARFKALIPGNRVKPLVAPKQIPLYAPGTLYAGMPHDTHVAALQRALMAMGVPVPGTPPDDGWFGGGTKEAVKVAQHLLSLTITGVADKPLLDALGLPST